jgi:hypothetical protein
MGRNTLTAVFTSMREAAEARDALIGAGFQSADLTISADLTSDGIAAEAPGQAYENQHTQSGAGIVAWVKSSFSNVRDEDTSDAQRMADVQRGSAVLSFSGSESDLDRASEVLEAQRPVALRRT